MYKARVLIVEDNFIVMMELSERLTEMGYQVVETAASGPEAIQKVGEYNPDLIMMDIRLKGEMDGIEAASKIRKNFDIPLIYLTAHTDDDTVQRAKLTEPFGYIIKPFEERELNTTIEMALYKHRIEKRLKESEHWLSATLKSIGDALIATDSTGIIKLINPIAEEMTGWRYQEVFGRDINDIFVIKEHDGSVLLQNPVKRSAETGSIIGETDKILVSKNGNETPVDYSAAPIKDSKNNTDGFVLVFRDITEKKKAKEVIEKQRIFLRQIIDTDPNYITVKDSEGKFELTNKAAADALGCSIDEIVGKNDYEFFANDEVQLQRQFEQAVLHSEEEVFIPEDKLIDSNGKVHLLQTFKRAIDSQNGNKKLVLSVASDITQLKVTEKALRESEETLKRKAEELELLNARLKESQDELKELNASKDKFMSIIAHDLRSPFTALLGLSNFLVDEVETIEKDELRSISGDILSTAKSTFGLLENLLQWARVKTGRIEFMPADVNISSVMHNVLELYQANAENKNIAINVNIEKNISAYADSYMAETILRNLVSNSIKFTKNGGSITVSASETPEKIEVAVEDNGIGIKPCNMEKLFRIDQNISTKGTDNEEGSGIGLLLCKEFVELNSGTIKVKSEPGEGSTFIFTLPKSKNGKS